MYVSHGWCVSTCICASSRVLVCVCECVCLWLFLLLQWAQEFQHAAYLVVFRLSLSSTFSSLSSSSTFSLQSFLSFSSVQRTHHLLPHLIPHPYLQRYLFLLVKPSPSPHIFLPILCSSSTSYSSSFSSFASSLYSHSPVPLLTCVVWNLFPRVLISFLVLRKGADPPCK